MKIKSSFCSLLLLLPCVLSAQSADRAYLNIDAIIDYSIAPPEVNINLPPFLLNSLKSDLAEQQPELAEITEGINSIRVLVIPRNDENSAHLAEAYDQIHTLLEKDWTPILSVPEENLGIYAISDETGLEMAGIAGMISAEDNFIVINLAGKISLGKLLKIAHNMDAIDLESILQGFNQAADNEAEDEA